MPTLDGVQLEWSQLFQPYALNFVQYRKVMNLTQTAAADDLTPFTVLPMVFENSAQQFVVPQDVLLVGTYYEFRLGFPFPSYTYYTDSVVVMTFDSESPFVNNLVNSTTSTSISLSWEIPEYADGIFSYEVSYYVGDLGNGGVNNPSWNVSALTFLGMMQATLIDSTAVLGCPSGTGPSCLVPYTTYLVQVTVIRKAGPDAPLTVYIATAPTVPDFSPTVANITSGVSNFSICASGLSSHDGVITQVDVSYVPTGTSNPVLSPVSGLQSFYPPPNIAADACFAITVTSLIPLSSYAVAARVWTSAGPGPYSQPIAVTTTKLTVPPIFPSVRRLDASELPAGWTSGYLVSWTQPPEVHAGDVLGYEAIDTGITVRSDPQLVYNGTSTQFKIETIKGMIEVRIVLTSGPEPLSAGVTLAAAPTSSTNIVVIIVPVVVCSVLVLILLAIYGRRRYIAHKIYQEQLEDVKRRIPAEIIAMLSQMNGGHFLVPRAISPLNLTFLDTLGEGKFGAAMKALLDESDETGVPGYLVAVKMAKEEASNDVIEEMRTEAAIMAQFQHKNVVGLIGQVSEPGLFLIVLQFCEHGSLLSWIMENGPGAGIRTLINMCVDTASGMAYLESLGVVHRDLAARNVLVASDLSCKVSDFGLSQHSNEGAVKTDAKDQVAVRWAAPEAIADHRYTSKSDVWSYGITLFEIFTFGGKPYEAWSNRRVLEELRKGYRLEKPDACPTAVYELMMQCWHADPEQRPDFNIIVSELFTISMSTVEVSERQSSTGNTRNKLVERFNAAKQALHTGTSQTSGNEEHGSRLGANSTRSRKGQVGKSSSRKGQSDAGRHSPSVRDNNSNSSARAMLNTAIEPAQKVRNSSRGMKSHLSGKFGRQASYLAVVGQDGKLIPADLNVAVPPLFDGLVNGHVPLPQFAPGEEVILTLTMTSKNSTVHSHVGTMPASQLISPQQPGTQNDAHWF